MSRRNSAQMLLDKIRELEIRNAAVIIMGDFNAGEDNPAFRTLLENKIIQLKDSFRFLHPSAENAGTFNGFKGISSGDKIDAILVSPVFNIMTSDIIHSNKNGFYPSDHFPVTATLSLE